MQSAFEKYQLPEKGYEYKFKTTKKPPITSIFFPNKKRPLKTGNKSLKNVAHL
jgi:hypothetical protein